MRILHIYSGNLFGGIETTLLTFAAIQSEISDFEQEFALCFPGRLWSELTALNVQVHDLGKTNWRYPHTLISSRSRLEDLLKKSFFDIVICHSPWIIGIFGSIIHKVGLPLVFWAHDFLTGKSWVELTAFRSKPEWVICNSRYTLKSVQEQYPGVRTEVIYCPVRKPPLLDPRAVRKRVRENLKISESAVVLFQASRMEKSKGHSLVLEALSELKDSPEWVALFAGGAQRGHEKTYFDQMVRYSHQLGLGERVQFLGQRSDVSELLLASDVFIQPNLMPETFGISFIEAMYAGLPTVGVAGGGVDEIVTEEAGILISKPQSELLVPVLKELIGSSEKRAVLGQNGKIRADQLSNPIQQLLKTRDFLKVCLS